MIDSHAHLASKQFNEDREQTIVRAEQAGVTGWIEIGTSITGSENALNLAKSQSNVYSSVGIHPDEINKLKPKEWDVIDSLIQERKVVAIGEIGFDYYRGGTYEKQLPIVNKFIHKAQTNKLPIIWHLRSNDQRDANEDLLTLLKQLPKNQRPKGVAHTFSGTTDQAGQYLKLGMYIGISGIVTFKNAGQLIDVVKATPLKNMLIETDCPYLAPKPHRGQRNEPAYVKLIAQKIAEIKNISIDQVVKVTEKNTEQLFQI